MRLLRFGGRQGYGPLEQLGTADGRGTAFADHETTRNIRQDDRQLHGRLRGKRKAEDCHDCIPGSDDIKDLPSGRPIVDGAPLLGTRVMPFSALVISIASVLAAWQAAWPAETVSSSERM